MSAAIPPLRLSWPRLVTLQLSLIWQAKRWLELVGGVVVLLAAMSMGASVGGADREHLRIAVFFWAGLSIVLVGAWPAMLWRAESPRERRYHWSLPVSHGKHDLARVMAGGIWVIGVAIGVTIVCALSVPDAGSLSWFAAYALGALTVYGLCSIPAVTVAKPGHWIIAAVLIALLAVLAGRKVSGLSAPVDHVLSGRYGFASAALGAFANFEIASLAPISDGQGKAVDSSHALNQASQASLIWLLPTVGVLLLTSVMRRER